MINMKQNVCIKGQSLDWGQRRAYFLIWQTITRSYVDFVAIYASEC